MWNVDSLYLLLLYNVFEFIICLNSYISVICKDAYLKSLEPLVSGWKGKSVPNMKRVPNMVLVVVVSWSI